MAVADGPLLVLVGPTAVGKSALALRWAERVGAEIVAADSTTVYRGVDIGTAKPTTAERARVRHHLVDVADPREQYTVARFVDEAQRAAADIRRRGRLPLVVGGTGLFVRALVAGYRFAPAPAPELRGRLEAWWAREGPEAPRRQLSLLDPTSFHTIPDGDRRRTLRALEAFHATGRPLPRHGSAPSPQVLWVGLVRSRDALARRIESRAQAQLAEGLPDEVLRLHGAGVPWAAPALRGLGYRECAAWARGRLLPPQLLPLICRHTRQYAKRQMTWFRRDPAIRWIDLDHVGEDEALATVVAWTKMLGHPRPTD